MLESWIKSLKISQREKQPELVTDTVSFSSIAYKVYMNTLMVKEKVCIFFSKISQEFTHICNSYFSSNFMCIFSQFSWRFHPHSVSFLPQSDELENENELSIACAPWLCQGQFKVALREYFGTAVRISKALHGQGMWILA